MRRWKCLIEVSLTKVSLPGILYRVRVAVYGLIDRKTRRLSIEIEIERKYIEIAKQRFGAAVSEGISHFRVNHEIQKDKKRNSWSNNIKKWSEFRNENGKRNRSFH